MITFPREIPLARKGARLPPSLGAAGVAGGPWVLRLICQNQFEAEGCKAGLRAARKRYSICSFAARTRVNARAVCSLSRTGVSRYVALRNRICSSLIGAYRAMRAPGRIDRRIQSNWLEESVPQFDYIRPRPSERAPRKKNGTRDIRDLADT